MTAATGPLRGVLTIAATPAVKNVCNSMGLRTDCKLPWAGSKKENHENNSAHASSSPASSSAEHTGATKNHGRAATTGACVCACVRVCVSACGLRAWFARLGPCARAAALLVPLLPLLPLCCFLVE